MTTSTIWSRITLAALLVVAVLLLWLNAAGAEEKPVRGGGLVYVGPASGVPSTVWLAPE
jgi:hypothetical protein